jgi:hypothetical protein
MESQVILTTWEAEIKKTSATGQHGQKKFMRPPSQWENMLGMVVHSFHPRDSIKCKIGGLWEKCRIPSPK